MSPHSAFLIVDVQRAFQPPSTFLKKLERYAKRFPCLIFTRFVNPAASPFRRLLKQKCCGSANIELLLRPGKEDLVMDKVGKYGLTQAQLLRLTQ